IRPNPQMHAPRGLAQSSPEKLWTSRAVSRRLPRDGLVGPVQSFLEIVCRSLRVFGIANAGNGGAQVPSIGRHIMQQLKDVMTQDVKILSSDTPIKDAARQMRDGDFGLMPVGDNDRLVGTLSDRDIVIRAVADGRDGNTKVGDV